MKKWGVIIALVALLVPLLGCGPSTSSHEGMVNYNGEWIPREEYLQIKEGGESSTTEEYVVTTPNPEVEALPESESEPQISVSVEITDCEQIYYDSKESWGNYVDVSFEITNTGDIDIWDYELYFTVLCEDGTEYEDSDHDVILHVGDTHSNSLLIDVDGREVDYVEITDWEIKCTGLDTVYKTSQDPTPKTNCTSKDPPLNADVRVKNWSQDYWDYFEEWDDLVEIYIEIENTGDLDIDYFEIFYVVECRGGHDYHGMTNGLNLRKGREDTIWTIEMVNGHEVEDVEIEDWDLTSY